MTELRTIFRNVAKAPKKSIIPFARALPCGVLNVVSFARCATGCSASAHIAQRTRSNVTTATRATRSRPQLLLLQPAKPGTQGSHITIPWNDLHFIWYGISLYDRATSIKILTCSYFLVSYSSLKHTHTQTRSSTAHTHAHARTHTHSHSYIHIHVSLYTRTCVLAIIANNSVSVPV